MGSATQWHVISLNKYTLDLRCVLSNGCRSCDEWARIRTSGQTKRDIDLIRRLIKTNSPLVNRLLYGRRPNF